MKKGFTLIETLIVILIAMILLSGLISSIALQIYDSPCIGDSKYDCSKLNEDQRWKKAEMISNCEDSHLCRSGVIEAVCKVKKSCKESKNKD